MKTRKKRISLKNALIFAAVIVIAAVLSTAIAVRSSNKGVISVKKFPIDLVVSDIISINLDKDAIHMGGIFPEGSTKRGIIISNDNPFPVKAIIYAEGKPLASWVTADESSVLLEPFETNRNVTLTAAVPKDAVYGKYTGELIIVFKKA